MIEIHRTIALQDHFPMLATALGWAIMVIELFAAAILFMGFARFVWCFVGSEIAGRSVVERNSRANIGRIMLARYILMALEVFIVADLLMTLLSLSLQSLMFLGLLVVIRSIVSYFLEHEMRAIRAEDAP